MTLQAQLEQSPITPITLGVPPPSSAGVGRGETPARSSSGQSRAILLVEDDGEIREALREMLEDERFAVTTAENGLEAMQLLRAGAKPDLIILDLRMPIMDGWRFRAEQKADPMLAGIPVVAISADGSPQAAAIDAAAYLRKPLDTDTLLDVIARVLGEAERRHLVRKLEEAERFAALGRLAASVGHEINNPLTCVSINVDTATSELGRLLRAGQPDPRLHEVLGGFMEMFQESRAALDRIRDVVRDLQRLSRGPEARRSKFSINEVLDESLGMARNQIQHRAAVRKRYGDLPAVFGDRSAIGQVLLNLLLNAVQSLPHGRADGNEIRLATWREEGGDVVVEVADTGAGIPTHVLPHIFDPFFTTKPVGEGTGLGLAVSSRIVADHGGRIDVDSVPGEGSSFRMVLPVGEPARVSPAGAPAPATGLHARVLVIDDEPAIGRTITVAMPEHEVTVVTSAQAAFARFAAGEPFDVILCDLLMPELDGRDVLARVEAEWPHLAPRMVFMTGGAFTPESQAFLQRTEHQVLFKPFSIPDLAALVTATAARAERDR
jgi:signal transduction histidine kinase